MRDQQDFTDADKARIMRMTPHEYSAWLTSLDAQPDPRLTPPDPYALALGVRRPPVATDGPIFRTSEANPLRAVRLLRSHDEMLTNLHRDSHPPDPYRAATASDANERAAAITPSLDPRYRPHGQPPDPYTIGLAARQVTEEDRR